MKRPKFTVHLPKDHVARFSDYDECLAFARARSLHGTLVEVSDRTGLIAQCHHGSATPEFRHLQGYSCLSVLGGWQTRLPDGTLVGPIFNDVPDLWKWQKANMKGTA